MYYVIYSFLSSKEIVRVRFFSTLVDKEEFINNGFAGGSVIANGRTDVDEEFIFKTDLCASPIVVEFD